MEHLRPSATARLVLDPPGRGTSRFWAVLMADEGFYLLYKNWLPQHPAAWESDSPGGWRSSILDLSRREKGKDLVPRLAWVPLELRPSQWGPHISVIFGEHPRKNGDLWSIRSKITQLEARGPSRTLDRLYEDWDRKTRGLTVPSILEGRPVRFEYDPESLNRSPKGRWCFHAFTEAAAELRSFFGLNPRIPRHSAPLHLTVGKEDSRGGAVR